MAFQIAWNSPRPRSYAKQKVQSVQEYTFLAGRSLANLFERPTYFGDMVQQADLIGVGSISIVLSACFFIGVALALNSATTLGRFGARTLIGELVAIGVIRELGPLLAGLVVAGRNASGMASELGSMVVTEQIDAMRALGTDPMKKLVTPRVSLNHVHALLPHHSRGLAGPARREHGLDCVAGFGFAPVLEYGLAVVWCLRMCLSGSSSR
jgi:ABC transport permease subunit